MTKKMLSLLIALALLFSVASALAAPEKYKMIEDFAEFDIVVEIPEGAQYRQNPREGWLCLEIWFEDPAKPFFDINVSFSEEMAGQFLGNLSQEEQDHLMEMVGENFSLPVFEFFLTPSGNTILFTRETDPAAGDYAAMTTVYKGFFFQLYASHKDYAPLTDADIQLMHQIIEGAWIIDTDAAPQVAYTIEDESVLIVSLEANATTGYEWTFTLSDEGMLDCVSEEYLADESPEGMVGTGGTYIATFRPAMNGAGWVTITFSYARPWETDEEPEITHELKVWVTEAGTLSVGKK